MSTYAQHLAYLHMLKAQLKACQAIYQFEEKQSVAKFYGIVFEKLAHMEFQRWRRIADRYSKSLDQMFAKVRLQGTEEELKTGLMFTRFYVPRKFCRFGLPPLSGIAKEAGWTH